jgi:UDP-N-acetylmuramoyl-tripeptide--D-alanyl-D-alanine ligase
LEKIAEEKAAILKHTSNALLDADSEWFDLLKSGFTGSVVTLTEETFNAPQPGAHMIQNTRFAATIGLELGLSAQEIQAGLNAFSPVPMRWAESEQGGVTFINDAYNANPLSMRAALSTFAELPCTGRKFVVLGGMRELGAQSESEHRELGAFVDALNFDGVITIGELGSKIVCNGITGIGKATAVYILRDQLRSDDKVLFKASRGEQLETILEELKAKIL